MFILYVSVPGCYEERDVTEYVEYITSPNYPEDYPENLDCVWVLYAPEGKQIHVRVLDAEIEESEMCENDGLGVKATIRDA